MNGFTAFVSNPNVRFCMGLGLAVLFGQTLYDWARYALYKMNQKLKEGDDNDLS